jgi:hypothetical protein
MLRRITAGPRRDHNGCGMLPDIRFAIGAVLLSTLLIMSALGLAATVRIAHHRAVGPLEASRVLAYSDPADWGSGSGLSRRIGNAGSDAAGGDTLLDRIAAIPLDPDAPRFTGGADYRDPPGETASSDRMQPAEPDRGASAQIAASPAVADEGTTVEANAELSRASARTVTSTKSVKKKVAKKRRRPAQTEVSPSTARTGYPVTGDGNTFEFQVFRD